MSSRSRAANLKASTSVLKSTSADDADDNKLRIAGARNACVHPPASLEIEAQSDC